MLDALAIVGSIIVFYGTLLLGIPVVNKLLRNSH